MRLFLIPLVLLAAACSKPATPPAAEAAAAPPTSAALPAVVTDYLAAIDSIDKSTVPVSLEALLNKAEDAQAALMEVTGDKAVLERFSDPEFVQLQAQVKGLVLHRGNDIYAQPEPAFFLALAKAHGEPADVAFFEQYAAVWGPDLVPNYLQLRAQPTPCVRFGEGRIAPLYAGWRAYSKNFPAAYTTRVAQQLKDLEEAVALGTCACAGVDSVRAEQAEFLKQFPGSPEAATIKARREELVKNPTRLPVNCR